MESSRLKGMYVLGCERNGAEVRIKKKAGVADECPDEKRGIGVDCLK